MGQPLGIAATTRKTKRFVQVLRVLASNGFETFVEHSRLIAMVEGGWSKLNHKPVLEHTPIPLAVRLRQVCEELGATFVKLGQVLSTRPDLIPAEVAGEFKKLQHDVSRVPFEELEGRLREAYPEGIEAHFQSIDPEPMASASMAQVHRAVMADGQSVVLKVIKPGIGKAIQGDLAILRDLADLAAKYFENLGFDPNEVVEEFARHIEIELDLVHEGRATERLARYFKEDPSIRFPAVFWTVSRPKVLALEEIQGRQLSRLDPATLSAEERITLCQLSTRAVFRMCLEFGYFHADPHPGNIFFDHDDRLVLIDCGMTGFVENRTRYLLGEFVRAVIDRDLDRTARVAIEISDADPALEKDRHFRRDLWEMIGRCESGTLDGLDFTALLHHFFEVLRKYRIHCPGDLVYLIKALMTIEGVVEEIEPSFDLVETARPLLRKMFAQHYGWSGLKERLLHNGGAYVELVESLPHEVRDLLIQMRRRGYTLRVKHDGGEELKQAVVKTGQFLAMALILSSMLLSSAVLMHIGAGAPEKGAFTVIGWVTLTLCLIYALVMAHGAWHRRDR